jgi:teichuronic acid exporter
VGAVAYSFGSQPFFGTTKIKISFGLSTKIAMMSFRQKIISGFKWSFLDSLASQGTQYLVGIILARLLTPREFGLIGMILIFTAISQSIIDCGFGQALIRKKDCSQEDYSTVFFFNIGVGLFIYAILFVSASHISRFFNQQELVRLVRVLGINIVLDSFGIVQRTIIVKDVNFRLQAKISFFSAVFAGVVGIVAAYGGWGVWSLVAKSLCQNFLSAVLLWTLSSWRPSVLFGVKPFREMFGFGSKLLVSGLIDTFYKNVYYLIIGKWFSAVHLGYYTRADDLRNIPSANVAFIVGRVSYPVLASMQENGQALKAGYKKLIESTMFVSFTLMMGMAAVAKPMIVVLMGEKWLPAVPYLQLLCFVGMLYPLHALNLNMLNVKGRSDLFLRLEIIKKTLAIPTIVIGVFYGIEIMITGMIVNSCISYFLNSYWSGATVDYPMKEQLRDILPSFGIAAITGLIVFGAGRFLPFSSMVILCIQLVTGAIVTFSIARLVKLDAYMELSRMFLGRFGEQLTVQEG